MFEKRILNIYSIIIGIFFLVSGFGKVINTSGFSGLISQYGFDYLMILSPIIVVAEILLGLFLVLLIYPKRSSIISLILLIIFTLAFAYAHFAKGVDNCGCFGSMNQSSMPPFLSFIRNFILIIIALIVSLKYPNQESSFSLWKKYIIVIIMSVSIFIAGYTFLMPSFNKKNPGTMDFQSKDIKNTEFSKYIKTSTDSTYMIFCFSYSCPHCWNSIENLRQFIKSNTVDRVITFATGDKDSKKFFIDNFKPDFLINELPYDSIKKLTKAFPTAYYVEHDTIKYIIPSVLPSSVTFKKEILMLKKQTLK